MSFFDTNPLGRILNRFSVDQQKIDVQLSPTASQLVMYVFNLTGTLIILTSNSPWIAISLLPLSYLYVKVASFYRSSSRELQRLDSISKSPIYTAFTEAVNGTATIQAFGATDRFAQDNAHKFDYNCRAGFISYAANRWLTVRLEFLSNILLMLTALLSVLTFQLSGSASSSAAAAMAGLALSYAPGLSDTLNWLLRQFTTLETMMVSIERLVQYARIDPEEVVGRALNKPAPDWPARGAISFKDVTMCYREGLPNVLDGMSLEVAPSEKIGIVGRTGAGKSSVLVCLFRLVELKSGLIEIDGEDIYKLPLRQLRSRLAIIPQDPVLITGTLRYNLDPFDEFSDELLWKTLGQCSMEAATRAHPDGLSRQLDERGANLSMGQRQLVCMCRALLKNSRVLVLDEATASVDRETEDLIQRTLESALSHVTTLLIAHRLETIMNCDRVVVMAAGKVVESGPPLTLRETAGSRLRELWEARG
uniref:ATP-dependent transporter ycf16 n=1 Tax=Calcidiscus leptoporus TaxID=127549 RepID=A0A7S0JEQ6_9EUKA